VIGHLGAVVNFFAGTVKRAPVLMQRYGLEWIWRITEEPELWRRYFWDGLVFLWLFMSRVLPYALWLRISPYKNKKLPEPKCQLMEFPNHVDIKITGACRHDVLNNIRAIFREAASLNKECFLDLSDCDYIDSSFIGCVFLLKKALINKAVKLIKTKKIIEQILYWNCAEFIYKNK
jgi:N-acetylglucosaminyldiphosphoundecaprenol N-acetyl-beta-D-mannosaminyltransferase